MYKWENAVKIVYFTEMPLHRQQLAENNLSIIENKPQILKAKPKLKNVL